MRRFLTAEDKRIVEFRSEKVPEINGFKIRVGKVDAKALHLYSAEHKESYTTPVIVLLESGELWCNQFSEGGIYNLDRSASGWFDYVIRAAGKFKLLKQKTVRDTIKMMEENYQRQQRSQYADTIKRLITDLGSVDELIALAATLPIPVSRDKR